MYIDLPSRAVLFKIYDIDEDGLLSEDDMCNILKHLAGEYMTEEQRKVDRFCEDSCLSLATRMPES